MVHGDWDMKASKHFILNSFFFCLVIAIISLYMIRDFNERKEQKRSILLRCNSDIEIIATSKINKASDILTIKAFSWDDIDTNCSLFITKYAYYCRSISSVISIGINRDTATIPLLQSKISLYIENPIPHNYPLFRYFVWALLYIEGEPAFFWLEQQLNTPTNTRNSHTKQEFTWKKDIISYGKSLLWLDYTDSIFNAPDFIDNIQIDRFDNGWPNRFYHAYCLQFGVQCFNSVEEWCGHIKKNAFDSALLARMPLQDRKIWEMSCGTIYNTHGKKPFYNCTICPGM